MTDETKKTDAELKVEALEVEVLALKKENESLKKEVLNGKNYAKGLKTQLKKAGKDVPVGRKRSFDHQ